MTDIEQEITNFETVNFSNMKRLTYRSIAGESVLISEEHLNENGDPYYRCDLYSKPMIEHKIQYDANRNIIEEKEISEGEEMSKEKFIYDEKGKLIQRSLYVGGELYEKNSTHYFDNGYTRTTEIDGEITEKETHEEDGWNYTTKFYEDGELIQTERAINDEVSKTRIVEILSGDGKLLSKNIEYYDNDDNIIREKLLDENEEFFAEYLLEYKDDKRVKQTFRYTTPGDNSGEGIKTWEYDGKGNTTRIEKRDLSGKLIEFHYKEYDENGRVKYESGISEGWAEPANSIAIAGHFELTHNYEE